MFDLNYKFINGSLAFRLLRLQELIISEVFFYRMKYVLLNPLVVLCLKKIAMESFCCDLLPVALCELRFLIDT